MDPLLSGISNEINELKEQISSSPETEISLTERNMKAFAVSSKCAGDKLLKNTDSEVKIDTRVYRKNGQTYYPWLFSKTLKHDSIGLTRKEDLDRLINVSKNKGTKESIENLSLSQDPQKVRKLEGVATGNSFVIHGCDSQHYDTSKGFLYADDPKNVCEMIEVYEKSLLRDLPFIDIQNISNLNVSRAIQSMNNYNNISAYTGPVNSSNRISGKELFRGIGKDETIGPYVSQFLILPFSYNGISVEQKYPVENDVISTINYNNYLNIQRGRVTGRPNFSGENKYAYSGRILGSIVHNDPMYWAYYNAALIGLQNGLSLEYNGTSVTSAWTDQGPPDCLASVAEVALGALRVAWNSKYNIGLKLRPEAMAHRIDQINKNVFTGGSFDTVKNYLVHGQNTLNEVLTRNSNYLLRMMYPEGSPTHPSYPAGHAVVAGACTTVLKAFFKTHDSNLNPLKWTLDPQHSINGNARVPYNSADSANMTICGEFNKLASNISIGRNIAGVHYRADGDRGIEVGEKFAIKFLQTKLSEYISTYNGMINHFILEKMNGELIKITSDNITVLKSR
jgi:hypothetical protein